MDDLATCSYATEAFTELLNQIQAAVRSGLSFDETYLNPFGRSIG